MPLIETKGALSSQAYGQFARQALAANYIEDVLSTYLYTGNGSTQTITNGIDLSTKGGLLWIKGRSATSSSWLVDTARGNTKGLYTSSTLGEQTSTGGSDVSGFSSSGFSLGANQQALVNTNGGTFASWTFRKQAKFFDVVTYTGNGSARTIAHNLGSAPGCVIVKKTSATGAWAVWHRSGTQNNTYCAFLNTTGTYTDSFENVWGSSGGTPNMTSTTFSVGDSQYTNTASATYVAYLFAHDAGGFGADGAGNAISCGSYTGNGSATGPLISLGWEPQWLIIKNVSAAGSWQIVDNMRGMAVGYADATLQANANSLESSVDYLSPTATGFQITSTSSEVNTNASKYIYIAIRRGPMRTPTSGTSVFAPVAYTGTATTATITTGIVTDAAIFAERVDPHNTRDGSRLTGTGYLSTNTSDEERNGVTDGMWQTNPWDVMNGIKVANTLYGNTNYINWSFRRAPGFFDVVCYSGTSVADTKSHNLTVAPELVIIKCRNQASRNWIVGSTAVGWASSNAVLYLNTANPVQGLNYWNSTAPTATNFSLSSSPLVNASTLTYVAYLFATCPGVSKVGSYTGTGTTQQINCGFTGGARFVMIKRTDSTGDWYVWDTARGIVAGNDPYLLMNSTAAEVTNTDYIDTLSTGFEISSTAPAAINANGGTFIYLAIA